MWFEQDLPIEMNEIQNGDKEFHIQIVAQESYYSIEGIMTEGEFKKIVENIYLEIKDNRRYEQ